MASVLAHFAGHASLSLVQRSRDVPGLLSQHVIGIVHDHAEIPPTISLKWRPRWAEIRTNIALEINDCEIFFGTIGGARLPEDRRSELLFHDHVLPVTSPENERRVAALGGSARLDGFPLLHVDFYRDDPRAAR